MIATSVVCTVIILTLGNAGVTSAFHWSYKDEDTWPETCHRGEQQSPIALSKDTSTGANFPSFIFEKYDDYYTAKIKNNGHSVEIRLESAIKPTVRNGGLPSTFILDNLHFHWQSEHTVEDIRYPLELHLVHYDNKYGNVTEALTHRGGVAVLGVLFYLSPDDDTELNPLFSAVEQLQNRKLHETLQIDELELDDFLPRDRAGFYRYQGSLTTPGCTEGVIWTVFSNALPISSRQVKQFSILKTEENENLSTNYRSLQEVNGREILLKESPLEQLNGGSSIATVSSTLKIFVLIISLFKLS